MTAIVLDTETTGLTRRYAKLNAPDSLTENGDEVIQLGGIVLDEKMHPRKLFCHYCDCLLPESADKARAVHNIAMADIRKYIPNVFLEDVVARWVPELLLDDVVFIGYNTDFDMSLVAQSLRNFCGGFDGLPKVTTRMPATGRWVLDVMSYLPKRAKLSSFYSQLTEQRNEFYEKYAGQLPLFTNIPDMLEPSWQTAHNSLFDAIETYLLFMDRVYNKKLIVGR